MILGYDFVEERLFAERLSEDEHLFSEGEEEEVEGGEDDVVVDNR